jgi:hypothetical protein
MIPTDPRRQQNLTIGISTAALLVLFALVSTSGRTGVVIGFFGLAAYLAELAAIRLREPERRQLPRPTGSARSVNAPAFAGPKAETGWSIRQSLYLPVLVLPLGVSTVAVFLYLALRVRRPAWFASASGYGALTALWLTASNVTSPSTGIAITSALAFLLLWGGGLVHGFILRGHYLALLAARKADVDIGQRGA